MFLKNRQIGSIFLEKSTISLMFAGRVFETVALNQACQTQIRLQAAH